MQFIVFRIFFRSLCWPCDSTVIREVIQKLTRLIQILIITDTLRDPLPYCHTLLSHSLNGSKLSWTWFPVQMPIKSNEKVRSSMTFTPINLLLWPELWRKKTVFPSICFFGKEGRKNEIRLHALRVASYTKKTPKDSPSIVFCLLRRRILGSFWHLQSRIHSQNPNHRRLIFQFAFN